MSNIRTEIGFASSDLKYLLGYLIPILTLVSIYFAGILSYLTPIIGFVFIPFIEQFMYKSSKNLSEEEEQTKTNVSLFFDILLYFNVVFQLVIVFYSSWRVSYTDLELYEIIGIVASTGISCGALGINVAHELGHRVKGYEKTMAKILLMTSLYMHFYIEHNRGHHKNVSTDLDPASSKVGEILYLFWIRSIYGSYISAWHLEKLKLHREGLSFWSIKNEMIWYQVIQVLFICLFFFLFGISGGLAFLVSALIGILLLETINYVEHYGLRRREIEPGIYEKVKPTHSWNSNHQLGRIILYELTRHSDHHYKANRKYQVLRHFDESPQLPLGYPGSMLLSLIPPLWFKIMNKEVDRFKQINGA